MNFILDLLQKLFDPAISFLKQEGLWHYIVSIYMFIHALVDKVLVFINTKWNIDINYKTIIEWLIKSIKFIIELFIALFRVIVRIYEYIKNIL